MAVDVGGRDGALVRLLQKANPALRGIVFDRPDVAAAVRADVEEERLEVVGGDFFKALPTADLYLLKFILHDWDDERCVDILTRCREGLVPGGRIAVFDCLIGDGSDPGIVALMDLLMLTVANGSERTLEEFDALFAKAGLRRTPGADGELAGADHRSRCSVEEHRAAYRRRLWGRTAPYH